MTEMLEGFSDTSKLIIKQNVEPMEAFAQAAANAVDLDFLGGLGETANKYDVYVDDGEPGQKYKVIEQSDAWGCDGCCPTGRICCRPNHKLELIVIDPEKSSDTPIMRMSRPCKCGQCFACCDICRQEMTIRSGDDQIAYIKQPSMGGCLSPQLEIMDREDGEPIGTITANAVCCIGGMCCDHTFEVTDADGQSIGKIVKERPENLAEFGKELATDADNFTLYVNQDLSTSKKASIFSATYLIDYMFFENEGDANLDLCNGTCSFKLCDCYCCGCVVPYTCKCGGEDGKEE